MGDDPAYPHTSPRWNHNIHYHRLILDVVGVDTRRVNNTHISAGSWRMCTRGRGYLSLRNTRPVRGAGAHSALDVGTGNGLLAAELNTLIPSVTGIDVDESVLASARAEAPGVNFLCGDVLSYPFATTFDVVASIATLHHLPDLDAALRRIAELTAPGGLVVTIGLARPTQLRDYAMAVVGMVQHRWLSRRHGFWEHSAPTTWPPPHSYSDVRRSAAQMLPGSDFRLLPLFRYSLTWRKPTG